MESPLLLQILHIVAFITCIKKCNDPHAMSSFFAVGSNVVVEIVGYTLNKMTLNISWNVYASDIVDTIHSFY